MGLAAALEAEAQAQALCMQHPDFRTAHEAFVKKEQPRFAGAGVCDEDAAGRGGAGDGAAG